MTYEMVKPKVVQTFGEQLSFRVIPGQPADTPDRDFFSRISNNNHIENIIETLREMYADTYEQPEFNEFTRFMTLLYTDIRDLVSDVGKLSGFYAQQLGELGETPQRYRESLRYIYREEL